MSQKSATEVCITTDFGPAVKNYKLQWIFIYYICDKVVLVDLCTHLQNPR